MEKPKMMVIELYIYIIKKIIFIIQLFNEWMHTYFYKYVDNYSVGLFLRRLYEQHIINTEEDFRKEMSKYVLFDCKKI